MLLARLLRNRTLQYSSLGLSAVVATIIMLFVGTSALTLSEDQEAELLLGAFDHSIQDRIAFGDKFDVGTIEEIRRAATDAGAQKVGLQLTSYSIRPDTLAFSFFGGTTKIVTYFENLDDDRVALPGAFNMATGLPPTTAGEVALSSELAREIGYPDEISAFGGLIKLRVTGTLNPVYGRDSWRIVAAPGTWQLLPADRILEGHRQAEGGLSVLWTGDVDIDALIAGVSRANLETLGTDSIYTAIIDRTYLGYSPPLSENLWVFVIPGLALVALTTLTMVNLSRRRLVAMRRNLFSVGIDDYSTFSAILSSLILAVTAAILVGATFGSFGAWLLRIFVLESLAKRPLSPTPSVIGLSRDFLIVGVISVVLFAWLRLRTPSGRRTRSTWLRFIASVSRFPWMFLRRSISLVAIAWSIPSLVRLTDLDQMNRAVAPFLLGTLLLVPDLLRLSLRTLSPRSPVTLIARRLVESDWIRYSGAVVALACVITIPTVSVTLYATQFRLEETRNVATVPINQLWVNGASLGGVAPVDRAVAALKGVPDLNEPIRFGMAEAYFVQGTDGGAKALWVFDQISDVETLFGDAWTHAATQTLGAKGVVTWAGAGPQIGLESEMLSPEHFGSIETGIFGAAGVILGSTAQELGIPYESQSNAVYTDVTDETRDVAISTMVANGISARAIEYHTPPPPLEFPPIWGIISTGLISGGFILIWLTLRSQASHLRGYASRLLAIGIDLRTSLRVFGVQSFCILLIGTFSGFGCGLAAIAIFANVAFNGELSIVIPWSYIGLVFASALAATVLAATFSLRALRPDSVNLDE